ncbi:hypothetical protein D3C72_1123740 [compost metagenome]
MRKIFAASSLIAMLFLSGCRTGGVVLRDTPLGISETRKAVVTVIGEPRTMSTNGREMFSKYYDKKGAEIMKMDMVRERFYSHVTVLGDRRPYDIQVEVLVEGRTPEGTFELSHRDDAKASTVAEKIRAALNQSRDNRNVIDDFRSF